MLDFIQPHSDQILMVCSAVFAISLFPQVLYNYRNKCSEIPYQTSILTTLFMLVITLVYVSNGFWLSTIMGTLATLTWATIGIQRYLYNKE